MPDSTDSRPSHSDREPRLELRPLRDGVAGDRGSTLDLLVVVHPPELDATTVKRPPINLGLVIDRSGSMAGLKLAHAKRAAQFAVTQLLPRDTVSVVTYDDHVRVAVPATPATDHARILAVIDAIQSGGTTALHAGWVEGGTQVARTLAEEAVNRVLLLSDGLANVGLTDPDAIASDVRGLRERGVGTSTMGVGDDYDELLLEAMARAGDGNFYHISSPGQIPDFFASELEELVALFAENVSLGVRVRSGVEVVDVLNDFDRTEFGNWMLPNLVAGSPVKALVRLRVPPRAGREESRVAGLRLAWDRPGRERRDLRVELRLPVLPWHELEQLPEDDEVRAFAAVLEAQRHKRQAMEEARRGRLREARRRLVHSVEAMRSAPDSFEVMEERLLHDALADDLDAGEIATFLKKARYESYSRRRGRRIHHD